MSATCSPATKKKIIEFVKKGLRPPRDHTNDSEEERPDDCEPEDEETLPIVMGYLTPRLKDVLKNKLNETEELKEISLKALKELALNEPGLVCYMDDAFLTQFLRARKYNLKRAFKLLQNYYSFRKKYADIIDTAETESVFKVIFKNYLGLLKRRDRNGCAVFIVKLGMWDPDVDAFNDLFRAIAAILVYAVEDPATQVAGFRVIVDTNKVTWKQMKHCTPQNALLVVRSTQFCFPGRYKGIHVVNVNKFFHIGWAIIYPFLTSKLKKRILVHGNDLSGLQEYISPLVLPEEYGGLAGNFENSDWGPTMEKAEKLVRQMMEYGYK